MVEEQRNCHSKYHFTVIVASILLVSLGILVQNVFAMGPSSCQNQYNGQVVVTKINNGTQTFDPLANPGVTVEVNKHGSLGLWDVIEMPGQSSLGRVTPGSAYIRYTFTTFGESTCHGYVNPNENLTESGNITYYGGYNPEKRGIGTRVNGAFWTIDWVSTSSTANTNNSTVPNAPTNLSAWGMSSSQIVLSWNAPANYTVTGYKIERSSDGGNSWSTAASNTNTTVTAYTDSGLASHATYYYRVSAINKIGTSPSSNATYGTTFYPTLSINTQDTGGNTISGFNATFSQNGNKVATGLTPTTFTLTNNQNYDLSVADGRNYVFVSWKDTNSTSRDRQISITVDTILTAVYNIIPQPPTNLSASAGNAQIALSWTAPSNNGGTPITNYNIYRSTSSGAEILLTTVGNVNSYVDNTVTNGQTYFYEVTAVNSVGESPQSNEASTTAGVPSAPTGLTATTVSSSQINLSWTASNNGSSAITGYKIERSADGGTTWSPVQSNSGTTATTYSDTGLAASTTYTYRVSAINSAGTSSPSNTASSSTSCGCTQSQPPTGLTAKRSASQIKLSWNAPSDNGGSQITNYKIYRSTSPGDEKLIAVSSNQLSYSDSSIANVQTYFYKVSAVTSFGESDLSNEANATTPTPPQPPTGLTATAVSSSQINLNWNAPTNNGGSPITNYNIERATMPGPGSEAFFAGVGNLTTYNDTSVISGQIYFYVVTAVNYFGNSAESNEASAPPAPGTVSSPPTGLKATADSTSEIDLTWTHPANNGGTAVIGYKVERSTDSGTTWNTIAPNTENIYASYTDTGLAEGATYTYRVSAINYAGTSAPSNTFSVTTFTVPQPPTNFNATAVSSSQIDLSWTAPASNGGSPITGYMIERSSDGGATWSTVQSNTGSTATYSDTGLAHSTTYTYRVSAMNSVGTSQPSNTTSATTLNTVPTPPIGLKATAQVLQINLSWNAPSDNGGTPITGYMIERSTDNGNTWSVLVANTGSTGTIYSDSNVLPLTTYTYRASAINNIGTGNPSNTASASTLASNPSPPTLP